MRSPLAYPLNRSADADVGGASDLQTDVMRFMAILSLCLVAIFALVQSMPMAPVPVEPPVEEKQEPVAAEPQPAVVTEVSLSRPAPVKPKPVRQEVTSLTRPQWTPVPRSTPRPEPVQPQQPEPEPEPTVEEPEGFTLRFESDLALTRLVATNQVGLYAIDGANAHRMSISESRISFWDASTPGSFHEMERSTVPQPVVDALARTGTSPETASWGVTLPGRLRTQLNSLMQEHRGGELVISSGGTIRREVPQ